LKLIIDGYNLIKKVAKEQHISSKYRYQYLKQLGIYAKNKNLQILIVFDGGESSFNYCEQVYGLEIIYSGFLESADDVIMRLIANHQYQEELMVVTSDREIIDSARQYTLDIIKSEEFYLLMQAGQNLVDQQIINHFNRANKTTSTVNLELDNLMELASKQVQPKTEELIRPRALISQKLSKHEKQITRKLKKL
jgi:predicted RNA-binding protein with PIN domain